MRLIKIRIDCCGECPFWNHYKNECKKDARDYDETVDPSFFLDCPVEYEDYDEFSEFMNEPEV